ncbi:acetyl-CoA carboxylase biotin carboxyl carrier protein [Murimonas intestini]|uniref:Biotin carboxyl carrier protein of acetyl-CoA carboxylase n=1 Tax=Murimonas intestini TaxID=1337051 RepID=A0AB73T4T1_9FIRM|nr:acetyl-CoA carboxylase biotin carboxyl carrier protein [Murimonas intestini]MCR1840737.1 acetyl-CoA carboxylase biotin carboxyl carrier protein [Murimonas intestini]MCR1865211.1 acetyl-CoA carboxylase biotin carboxyl carrier protein [Murimonas intestini]MCR1883078.1 acetyl-CoA carboxylase biotin carboxyl carrier protein [Murimonas intestini]
MEIENLLALIDKVSSSDLTEFSFEEGNIKLSMGKKKKNVIVTAAGENTAAPILSAEIPVISGTAASAGAGRGETGEASDNEKGNIITAPLVGTFYNSSSPDAEPFVQVGDTVKKGQTLGIIEAMKLMNEIESEFDGVVEEILAESQQMVEYGQPLFKIR